MHIVGVSSLAAGHLTLLPALKQALADHGRDDIMVVIGGVIPPDDVPDAAGDGRGRGVPARHGDRRRRRSTCSPSCATQLGPLMAGSTSARLVEGVARRPPGRGQPGDHAGRVAAAPTTGRAARELLAELDPTPDVGRPSGSASPGVPGRRQVDVHRGARHPADRRRPPGRRARRRPVAACAPAARCSATRPGWRGSPPTRTPTSGPRPQRRHARRRGPGDQPGDAGARGRGVRRGAGRDRRRRPVRDHRRRHGRHLPVPHPGPHRRPAAGHQEGHPRDRRRDRGQQGRRRPRGTRPRSAARELAGALRLVHGGGEGWAPPVVTCSGLHGHGVDDVWAAGARPPRAPRRRRAGRQARRTSSSTSPGRWSATSSSSGCAARAAVAAVRDEVRAARARRRAAGAVAAADRILAAYDGDADALDREPVD